MQQYRLNEQGTQCSAAVAASLYTGTDIIMFHVCPVILRCWVKITTGTVTVALLMCHKNIFTPKRM